MSQANTTEAGPCGPEESDVEVEGFGVSYDRHVMAVQQGILTRQLGLNTVLEMPSHGAKAAPSLYSLGYAMAGAEVSVVNFDERMRHYWQELGIADRLTTPDVNAFTATDFESNSFDLVWNFVTFTSLPDKDAYIEEVKRITRRYVMLIVCNNFQLGYPWHRVIHMLFRFPWNHGETRYNYVWNVKRLLRDHGLAIVEAGTIDSPPWPDPVGFRDVRLHRKGEGKKALNWGVPVVDYLKAGRFPQWMNLLRSYDIPLRKGYLKLPFSHLFYVLAAKS